MSRRVLSVEGGLGWDRVFRHFVLDGAAAALGPEATVCLLAIQALVNTETGLAEVSLPRLAKLTGVPLRSVSRALATLRAAEYVVREPSAPGKRARYRLWRWVRMTQPDGSDLEVTWPYIPCLEKDRTTAVGRLAETGDPAALPSSVTVHLHVGQLQIVQAGGVGVQIRQTPATDATAMAHAARWWQGLDTADWDAALAAAGLPGCRVTPRAKLAAWKAAGEPT